MANSDSKNAPAAPEADPAPAVGPRTVVAKLRCLAHRGETVNTRWGDVSFDRDGLAELEVPEDELQMLRDIQPHSWLAEDHALYLAAKKADRVADARRPEKADKKPEPRK